MQFNTIYLYLGRDLLSGSPCTSIITRHNASAPSIHTRCPKKFGATRKASLGGLLVDNFDSQKISTLLKNSERV